MARGGGGDTTYSATMRSMTQLGGLIGWNLATRPDVTAERLAYEFDEDVIDVTLWMAAIRNLLPPHNSPPVTTFERAALLACRLADQSLTVRQAAEITGLARNSAYLMLSALSRYIPVYDVLRKWQRVKP